jgi:hypothetical protein
MNSIVTIFDFLLSKFSEVPAYNSFYLKQGPPQNSDIQRVAGPARQHYLSCSG